MHGVCGDLKEGIRRVLDIRLGNIISLSGDDEYERRAISKGIMPDIISHV